MQRFIRALIWIITYGLLCFTFGQILLAQVSASDSESVKSHIQQYRKKHKAEIIKEFIDFLSIPNVASDHKNIQRNADFILQMLERRKIHGQLLQVDNAPPAVYGEVLTPGASKTIALYAHYDGQPVDLSQWRSGPWNPVLLPRALNM